MAWAWAHSVGVCGEAISEQGSPRHNHDGALSSSRGDEPWSRECALDSGACLPTGTSSAVVLTERELWEQTHQRIFFRFRACVAGGPALPFFIHTSARSACPLPRGSAEASTATAICTAIQDTRISFCAAMPACTTQSAQQRYSCCS